MNATLLLINEPVIIKAIETKQTKKIKLGDAIIAATALVDKLMLITQYFRKIDYIAALGDCLH